MNYKLFALIGIFLLIGVSSAVTYESHYPLGQNTTYVKATTSYSTTFYPWFATDPTESLTGSSTSTSWMSDFVEANQRVHIDLGSAHPVKNIMYSNYHNSGTQTDRGIDNFTFWGSNTSGSFATLVYANNTGWTQLTISQSFFTPHAASNTAELRNITVTNTGSYRYYAFKMADGIGTDTLAIRRLELQIELAAADITPPASITGLTNSTTTCEQINFSFTKPADVDYNGAMNWFNNAQQTNLTSTDTFKVFSGLTGGTPYTFSTKTFDTSANINATFVNMTATPSSCAVTPVASFTLDHLLVRMPHAVVVTDTSTNTPTSWAWSWGDGTANSTTQNPTHTYTQRGKFAINMAATNAAGTGVATAATVRVVGYENP